jgi:hypothetical protein
MSKRALAAPALLALLLAPGAQATTFLALDAGGVISGTPGQTIGWGYGLFNDTNFLVVTSAEFVPATAIGTFTDFIATLQFVVVGPPPEVTFFGQPFLPAATSGIGSFAIAPGATPGTSAIGQIVLTYDLYAVSPNDPSFDPGLHTLSLGNLLSADAGVAVVPEPGSLALLAEGLALLCAARLRRP